MTMISIAPGWPCFVARCPNRDNTARMTTDELEPGLSIAIRELLRDLPRAEDPIEDLCEAARESMRIRVRNSHNGGLVLAALRRRHRLTWREIERRTGINTRTARRWATPPPGTSSERSAT